MSFSSIAEYELGFRVHSISKKVSFDELYTPGHYHVGPSYTFIKCNRHVHTVHVSDSAAWTCPEVTNPETLEPECSKNATSNDIGQSIYTTFTVSYRIMQDLDSVQLAYTKYQFDDSRVASAVRSLATENSKETPQGYTLQEIIDAYTDELPQLVVNNTLLNQDLHTFGFQLVDVVVEAIDMDPVAQNKYLLIETRLYEDEISGYQEEAEEVRRETASEVQEIQNEQIAQVLEIQAYASAFATTREADAEAYRIQAEINATTELIGMYQTELPGLSLVETMELASTSQYVDAILGSSSSHSGVVFMDSDSNRLFTNDVET